MGKGDIKTRKGKRVRGSYGKTRKRKHTPLFVSSSKATAKKPTTKATKTKETEEKAETSKAETKKPAAKKAPAKKPAAKKPTENAAKSDKKEESDK